MIILFVSQGSILVKICKLLANKNPLWNLEQDLSSNYIYICIDCNFLLNLIIGIGIGIFIGLKTTKNRSLELHGTCQMFAYFSKFLHQKPEYILSHSH